MTPKQSFKSIIINPILVPNAWLRDDIVHLSGHNVHTITIMAQIIIRNELYGKEAKS